MSPYSLLFLQFQPEGGDVLERKQTRLQFQFDLANNLLRPHPRNGALVREDNEYQRLFLSGRYGLGDRSELRLFVPLLYRNGGFMDQLIAGWHQFWGISYTKDNPGRRPGNT